MPNPRLMTAGLLILLAFFGPCATASAAGFTPGAVNLSEPVGHFQVRRDPRDGRLEVSMPSERGPRWIGGEQFLAMIERQQAAGREGGWLFRLLAITSYVGVGWVALGFGGQLLFTGRMVVQWLVSEKRHRSTVPVSFWWMSIIGGGMLLTYFIWRKDIVGVAGQLTGVGIYARNLVLISNRKHEPTLASE